eukprot:CAMPEP_0182427982 /NCGR_PEP_ID=MMETSP1167-20130531/20933_1 /TAXON_ID=2988 /ORGANISM="Mallomonas Sp, Strain CCMP3275" /LENGTH=142 /DNA_ID=CAMNT_0024610593 /DNA_START=125 /DNA_END=553 /DNA_ORIENTATION=-
MKHNIGLYPGHAAKSALKAAMIECEPGSFDDVVINSKIPVVVDFYANWCGPCKLVAPIFNKLAEELPDGIQFVKVDTEKHEDTIEKYKLQGLPLFAVFVNGRIMLSHSGALSKEPLRTFIKTGLSKVEDDDTITDLIQAISI